MQSKRRIKRYTAKQINAKLARGESRTDWARVDAMSQDEVERLADEEEGPLPEGWEKTVVLGLPPGKDAVKLRIDRDVLAWFRGTGKGYQTRINNVLRAFVESHRRTDRSKRASSLQSGARFTRRTAKARASLRAGRGARLEDLD